MAVLATESLIFFFNLLTLFIYLKLSHKQHWFDKPNESRKLHNIAKPTSAGLVFMLPMVVMYVLPAFYYFNFKTVGIGMITLLILGGIDDFIHVSVKIRFMVITLVAAYTIYAFFGKQESPNLILLTVYVLGIIWWLNLYNFMDGADGMAIWHAVITTCIYIVAYVILPNDAIIALPYMLLFLFSISAFVFYNFPKATMFMGDSGSLSVAFVLAGFALYGLSHNIFDEIFVISLHLVFIVDATLTLFTRLKFKQKISTAHSLHLFQQMIKQGKSHAITSTIYASVTLIIALIALFLLQQQVNLSIRISVLLTETLLLTLFWYKFHKKTNFEHFIQ